MASRLPSTIDEDGVEVKPLEDAQRSVAGLAAFEIARRYPRSLKQADDRILDECTNKTVADEAFYSFRRGGQEVEGLSIRIAEIMVRNMGNMLTGVEELERRGDRSIVRSYCLDLETNTTFEKVFEVPHTMQVKDNRSGGYKTKRLTSERDIYEHVANHGARRQRACILAAIPKQIQERAAQQCLHTQTEDMGDIKEATENLINAFREIGVEPERIADRVGHHLTHLKPAEIIRLRGVYAAIRAGFSTALKEFPMKTADLADEMMKKA